MTPWVVPIQCQLSVNTDLLSNQARGAGSQALGCAYRNEPVNVQATPHFLLLPPASFDAALDSAFISHTNAGHCTQVLGTVAALTL